MRAPTVIAISAVTHVALFAGLSQIALPRVAPVATERGAVPQVDFEPIEVIVLEPPAAPLRDTGADMPLRTRVRAAGSPAPSRGASEIVSIAASATTRTSPTETAPDSMSSTGTPSDLMRMRARGTGLEVTAEMAARIPARPYVAPVEPKSSGRLENTPGGGAVVNDAVTTMTVDRDGHVTFADKPDIDLKLKLPVPDLDPEQMRKDLGRTLTEWFADPYAGTKFGRKAEVSRVWMAVPGACDSWGDVWCDDELAPASEKYAREQKKTGGSLLGGNADISAYLHRKYIGDPYASRKMKLLDDTRDERVARGAAFRSQQLVHSAELMGRTLEQLWAREADPVKRRAALFELWDDCDEGTQERGQAGQRARAMIIGWIGAHLPRGSADAYTDDEIRYLDARRSSNQPFAPYPAAPPTP